MFCRCIKDNFIHSHINSISRVIKYKRVINLINNNIKYSSSYCLQNVKKYDYENFLSTLLLPAEARDSAFAIRAFNIEIAQVRELTREELTARMRFQFWRETVDKIYENSVANNPVAKALYNAKEKHNLSKKWLKNLIDSREEILLERPFIDTEALETYSEKSNSAIYYLILQCMGIKSLDVDHVASHLGKSEGIVKFIRAIPHYGTRRRVLIPTSLLALHKVSQEDFIRGKREQKVKDVIFELASIAYRHLDEAKVMEKDVPKRTRVVFFPAVNVSRHLRSLQLRDFDIFDPKLQMRSNLLPVKLIWAKLRNSYR